MNTNEIKKNHFLAGQSIPDQIIRCIDSVSGGMAISQTMNEAEHQLAVSPPDILIVDEEFLSTYSSQFTEYFNNINELKFVPILYLTDQVDKVPDALGHFNDIIVADRSGSENLTGKLEKLSDPAVRIKFWGVRGSTPCANSENIRYGGNTSCVQIEKQGMEDLLIMDCGTGIRNLGNSLNGSSDKTRNGQIFITHPHWDHIQGFPFFKLFYSSNNTFSIHMPEQYRGGTQDILSGHLTKTFFPVTLDMLDATMEYITQKEEEETFADYTIEYMVANHPTKTAIYKVRLAGYTIIYCPDNEIPLKRSPVRFIDKFEKFISGCDVLIHDAQYTLGQYESRVGWGHSAWERVVEVAKRNQVKRLYLTHHDPDSSDDDLQKIGNQVARYSDSTFETVCLAKEGAEIRLPVKAGK